MSDIPDVLDIDAILDSGLQRHVQEDIKKLGMRQFVPSDTRVVLEMDADYAMVVAVALDSCIDHIKAQRLRRNRIRKLVVIAVLVVCALIGRAQDN